MKERERERPADEGDPLGAELRRLPTPMPPPAVVARVRRLAHARLAARAQERWERLLLVGVLLFSWLVSLFTFDVVRRLSGQAIAGLAATWITGAAALVLLALYARKKRRKA